MDKTAIFDVQVEFIKAAEAEYQNPLLSEVRLIFTDDQPNANGMGIKQSEFTNILNSMKNMPIKADFTSSFASLGGHDNSVPIGVIKSGMQEGNKLMALGDLWKDMFPDVVTYFHNTVAEGKQINFSWELYYKDSEEDNGTTWLKDCVTRAITAVENPAYQGRTPLLSISSIDLLSAIEAELKERGDE